ncbi:MAG TPA: hypothetical protein VF139_19310 [Candidatus Polarisedimenticolaceae bacterium]
MNHRMLRLALIGTLACVSGAAAAEEYGGCFRVDLTQPYVLPDGSVHDPGSLTICTDRPLNPVSGTHRMTASGTGVGRWVSRRVRSEAGPLDGPQVIFARNPNGTLRLLGYLEPAGGRVRAYAFGTLEPTVAVGAGGGADRVVLAAS